MQRQLYACLVRPSAHFLALTDFLTRWDACWMQWWPCDSASLAAPDTGGQQKNQELTIQVDQHKQAMVCDECPALTVQHLQVLQAQPQLIRQLQGQEGCRTAA